jgi:hypothetical protein
MKQNLLTNENSRSSLPDPAFQKNLIYSTDLLQIQVGE